MEKLKAYRDETAREYRERKDDFIKNRFDNTAFEQYRSRRAAERKAGFDECMSAPFALDFICQGSWGDPGVDADKSEFVDKALAKEGIFNNAAQRFPNSLYDSSFNRKATANRRYSYMPLRYTKDDRQWGIKLDLTGTYGLFGREHDFFVGYAYGDEKIRSEYLEIYERRHRVRPNTGATHGVYAGSCQEEPDGDLSSPLVRGHKEPDWQAYDEKGNRTVYAEECRNAKKIKTEPKLDAEGKQVYYYDEYSGSRTPVYVDVYELDEKGNKIQETNPDGTPAFTGFSGTVPVWKTVKVADDHVPALYNYAKYLNTNKTHSLTASTRFNVTGRLHLLGGLHYTRYETSQTKDMPVRYGQPASDFQTASSIKADQDHYTAKMQGHKLTPYAGITYDLTPQQSIYGSYTKIFKQQDNVDVSTKTVLPPLVGTNYEVGWKGAFLQGRLNASFALFYLEQKNRTVVDFGYVPGAGGKQGCGIRAVGRVERRLESLCGLHLQQEPLQKRCRSQRRTPRQKHRRRPVQLQQFHTRAHIPFRNELPYTEYGADRRRRRVRTKRHKQPVQHQAGRLRADRRFRPLRIGQTRQIEPHRYELKRTHLF